MNTLEKKLEEQLKLLKNSAELYDKGRVEEALNIAIRLRVLFYDTSSSTSLIKYLKQKRTLNLLSTLEDHSNDPLVKNIKIQFSIPFLTSNGQRAFLNQTGRNEHIPLKKWLTENITTLEGKSISRIDIILATTHKDGGAHVEIDHDDLKPFIKPFGTFTIKENNKSITKEIVNHHYILLRQIAYEVLHSEELFTINALKYKPMEEIKSYNEYLMEADNLNEENKYYKAIKLYEKAIEVNPDNATFAYNNMGNCLSSLGENDEAIKSYRKAIEQDCNYIDPLWNLSIIHNKEKRYDLAIELYQKILEIDKNHQGANNNLRATLNILTDFEDEIIEQYRSFLKNKPTNAIYIDYLAVSLLKYSYFQEAENIYKYSLQITPDNINHMNNLAYAFYKQEKYIDANTTFNNIIDIGTNRIDLILNILEFKLIKAFDGYAILLDNLQNSNIVVYRIFNLLFSLKNNKNMDDFIEELLQNNPNEIFDYNCIEIKDWLIENDYNKRILLILEKYFNLTTP